MSNLPIDIVNKIIMMSRTVNPTSIIIADFFRQKKEFEIHVKRWTDAGLSRKEAKRYVNIYSYPDDICFMVKRRCKKHLFCYRRS